MTRFVFLISCFFFIFLSVSSANAKTSDLFVTDYEHVEYIDNPIDLDKTLVPGMTDFYLSGFDIRIIIINILKYLMFFFGLVAVCVFLSASFRLKVASGSEDKIGAAKSMIVGGIIGLSTVVGTYVIVNFVIFTADSVTETAYYN